MTDVASKGSASGGTRAVLTNRQGHPVYDNQNQRVRCYDTPGERPFDPPLALVVHRSPLLRLLVGRPRAIGGFGLNHVDRFRARA